MSDTATANDAVELDQTPTDYVAADSTGWIMFQGTIPQFMVAIQIPPAGGSIVLGVGERSRYYVENGAITERPANTATLDGMTLKAVPPAAIVSIGATDYTVTDGTVELSFSQAGTYTVKVSAWPMLEATFEVTQA